MNSGYIDVGRLNKLSSSSHGVTITIYDRLTFKVAPDPRDVKRCQEAQRQYEQGLYVSFETKTISKQDFESLLN